MVGADQTNGVLQPALRLLRRKLLVGIVVEQFGGQRLAFHRKQTGIVHRLVFDLPHAILLEGPFLESSEKRVVGVVATDELPQR
jgi:hypothetical protein